MEAKPRNPNLPPDLKDQSLEETVNIVHIGQYPKTPEEATNALLDGVINHYGKPLTLLSMDPEPKSLTELYNAVSETVGSDKYFTKKAPQEYCTASFEGIALAARVKHKNKQGRMVKAHALSQFGQDIKPLLAYFLKWTKETSINIPSALGDTSSSGDRRAPTTRVQALQEIISNPQTTDSDIAKTLQLGEKNSCKATTALEEAEWIQRNVDSDTLYTYNGDPENIPTNPETKQDKLLVSLANRGTARLGELASAYDGSRTATPNALWRLVEKGTVTREHSFEPTEEGLEAAIFFHNIQQYIEELYDAKEKYGHSQAQQHMKPPKEIAEAWTDYHADPAAFNRKYATHAAKLYEENSPYKNRWSKEEGHKHVYKIVTAILGEGREYVTASQVYEETPKSKQWTWKRLNELANGDSDTEYRLRKEPHPKDGRKIVYYPTEAK